MASKFPQLLLVLVLASSSANAFAESSTDCGELFQRHLETDLSLNYKNFDQTQGSGFRVLATNGCPGEAADLIERYIAANQAEERSLRWHIAQLRATSGDYAEASRYARTVLNEVEDWNTKPLRWNDYVLATIAFLEKDLGALQQHRDVVAAGSEDHFGNKLNLKLLDALIRHFEQSYEYATSHIAD